MEFTRYLCVVAVVCVLSNCKTKQGSQSSIKEAWDAANAPEIFGVKSLRYEDLTASDAKIGQTKNKPWVDDYWPFMKKNMAKRYIIGKEFSSVIDQTADAMRSNDLSALSPAEKYDMLLDDPNWSLTSDGWQTFNSFDQSTRERFAAVYPLYKTDKEQKKLFEEAIHRHWYWMGICHGWANAAVREPAPQHAVVARSKSGKPIVFFEGDIRGLVSKAYATNRSDEPTKFMGARCNKPALEIIRDKYGRPVDGAFGKVNNGKFEAMKDHNIYIVKNDWYTKGIIEYRQDHFPGKTFWLASSLYTNWHAPLEGVHSLFYYETMQALLQDRQENSMGTRGAAVTVEFFAACRDLNAGSFHLVLSRYLSDAGAKVTGAAKGFVIELDRASEVWNFPIWGFKSEIGPLKSLAGDESPSRRFRAPSATHVADVTTRIVYLGEKGPDMRYEKEPEPRIDWESLEKVNGTTLWFRELKYSLEFDQGGFVVGGEWDEVLPLTPEELKSDPTGKKLRRLAPDFIWNDDGKITDISTVTGKPSVIKYSVVKKLLDCSQQTPDRKGISVTHKKRLLAVTVTEKIDAVTCDLFNDGFSPESPIGPLGAVGIK